MLQVLPALSWATSGGYTGSLLEPDGHALDRVNLYGGVVMYTDVRGRTRGVVRISHFPGLDPAELFAP